MAQKLVQAEREAQASLREQRAAHEEDLQRLQREKVQAAGEGWAGLRASVSSSFFLCLGLYICEMALPLCCGGPGDSWEDLGYGQWGRLWSLLDMQIPRSQIWSSPGNPDAEGPQPHLGNADLTYSRKALSFAKYCLHMKGHSDLNI